MKKFLIKIAVFALLSFIIQQLISNAPINSIEREKTEASNKSFNIITGGLKSFFIQLYIGDDLVYSDFESNSFAIVKCKVLKPTSCKIIYTSEEETPREIVHKFDIDDDLSTIYLILTEDEGFLLETIP